MIVLFVSSGSCARAEVFAFRDQGGTLHFSDTAPQEGHAEILEPEKRSTGTNTAEVRPPLNVKRRCGHETLEYCNTLIRDTAVRYGVDHRLVHAVVRAESDYDPYAISNRGAMGIMQLMPETARELSVQNVFSIEQNLDGGVRYLSYLLDRFPGDLRRAVAAYNAGPTAVEHYRGVPPFSETREYVKRVFRYYEELGGEGNGKSEPPTIYRIVKEDGSLLFTDIPAEYPEANRQEIHHKQEL